MVAALALTVWGARAPEASASSSTSVVIQGRVAAVLSVEAVDAHLVRVRANTPWTLVWAGAAGAPAACGGSTGPSGVLLEVPDGSTGWTLIDGR